MCSSVKSHRPVSDILVAAELALEGACHDARGDGDEAGGEDEHGEVHLSAPPETRNGVFQKSLFFAGRSHQTRGVASSHNVSEFSLHPRPASERRCSGIEATQRNGKEAPATEPSYPGHVRISLSLSIYIYIYTHIYTYTYHSNL